MKAPRITGIQYAALPYRLRDGRAQILLITSRRTRRWIIPKGWPMNGLKPQEAATIEAAEEAGIVGEVAERPIGSYRYEKRGKGEETTVIQVIVFPFRVTGKAPAFKEQGQREARWFSHHQAAGRVAEPSLKRLIRDFGGAHTPNPFIHALRTYQTWRFGGLPRTLWRW